MSSLAFYVRFISDVFPKRDFCRMKALTGQLIFSSDCLFKGTLLSKNVDLDGNFSVAFKMAQLLHPYSDL